MSIWNLVFLATVKLCLGDNNIMVPLYHDAVTGSPAVAVTVRGVTQIDARNVCTLARRSMFRVNVNNGSHDRTIILERNISFSDPDLLFITAPSRLPQMGMGPGSTMLETFSPIAFVRNSSDPVSLILNSTDDFFYNHCVPESVVTAPYTIVGSDIHLQGSIAMVDRAVASPDAHMIFRYLSEKVLMAIPVNSYNQLISSIEAAGLSRIASSDFFTNCDFLPQSLSLRIVIRTTDTSFAHLIVNPDDYLVKIPGTDRCRFQIVRSNGQAITLNPLMLPGLNVRIHREGQIQFCDTSL